MAQDNHCLLTVCSEHFLGTEAKCREFLDVLTTMDRGRWIPDKWGHYEPIRGVYSQDAHDAIVGAWTEERPAGSGRSRNSILFRKRTPQALVHVSTSRTQVPLLNWVSFDLAAKPFSVDDGAERLVEIMLAIVRWSDAVYATACHSRQAHNRSVGGTLLLRLQRLDWLTFFGEPYVEMFGRSRLLNAPCHQVREISGGVVMLATPRPDSSELTRSDAFLLELEQYLDRNGFAGYGYPEVPCRVPHFDLSGTVIGPAPTSTSGIVH